MVLGLVFFAGEKMHQLLELPDVIHFEWFYFLTINQHFNMACVSRRMNHLILIWKKFIWKYFSKLDYYVQSYLAFGYYDDFFFHRNRIYWINPIESKLKEFILDKKKSNPQEKYMIAPFSKVFPYMRSLLKERNNWVWILHEERKSPGYKMVGFHIKNGIFYHERSWIYEFPLFYSPHFHECKNEILTFNPKKEKWIHYYLETSTKVKKLKKKYHHPCLSRLNTWTTTYKLKEDHHDFLKIWFEDHLIVVQAHMNHLFIFTSDKTLDAGPSFDITIKLLLSDLSELSERRMVVYNKMTKMLELWCLICNNNKITKQPFMQIGCDNHCLVFQCLIAFNILVVAFINISDQLELTLIQLPGFEIKTFSPLDQTPIEKIFDLRFIDSYFIVKCQTRGYQMRFIKIQLGIFFS